MLKEVGTVIHVGETVQVSEKFKKRDLVLRMDGMYPQEVKFEAKQDRCSLLDELRLHQEIEVNFALEGRRWEKEPGRPEWFNTLTIIGVKHI